MGWDAYASDGSKEGVFTWSEEANELVIPNEKYSKAFRSASEFVKKKTGSVDFLLSAGGLDVSTCAHMLEKAGIEAWGDNLSAGTLASMALNWDFDFPENEAWAYWSALKFVEACKSCHLGIIFSW